MAGPSGLAGLFLLATLLVFCQLVVAATMRHQHAGLSIPDFPLAYHKLWPPMDAASVAGYNQNRQETTALNPITAFQIGLQMVHRILALTILCAVAVCARTSRNRLGARHFLTRICRLWLVLIAAQGVLGAFTIWSNKAADVATAHVVLGALCLLAGALLTILAFRVLMPFRVPTRTKNEPAAGLAAVRPAGSGAK